jgi:Fe-Mn family superoxide dismutase
LNPTTKRLEISTTPNQDPLLTLIPIIGVDIWEHAFYLQYLNVKVDVSYRCSLERDTLYLSVKLSQYLNAIWSVINFEEAEKRFTEGLSSSKL